MNVNYSQERSEKKKKRERKKDRHIRASELLHAQHMNTTQFITVPAYCEYIFLCLCMCVCVCVCVYVCVCGACVVY